MSLIISLHRQSYTNNSSCSSYHAYCFPGITHIYYVEACHVSVFGNFNPNPSGHDSTSIKSKHMISIWRING